MRVASVIAIIASLTSTASALEGSPPQPVILDANGKLVGALLSNNVVLLPVNNVTVIAMVISRDGFVTNGAKYYYTSADCTGQKYLSVGQFPDFGYTVGSANQFINYANASEGANVTANSSQFIGGCAKAHSSTVFAAPVRSISINRLGLTAPFRLALE